LEALKYLWEKLRILHGDISVGNILLCRVEEDQEAVGLLIDFDSAIIRAADSKVTVPVTADGDDGVDIVKECVWTVSVRLNCRETANGF
jgi:Ser/Thr protein kinase RdoA (MazF antagonist)